MESIHIFQGWKEDNSLKGTSGGRSSISISELIHSAFDQVFFFFWHRHNMMQTSRRRNPGHAQSPTDNSYSAQIFLSAKPLCCIFHVVAAEDCGSWFSPPPEERSYHYILTYMHYLAARLVLIIQTSFWCRHCTKEKLWMGPGAEHIFLLLLHASPA